MIETVAIGAIVTTIVSTIFSIAKEVMDKKKSNSTVITITKEDGTKLTINQENLIREEKIEELKTLLDQLEKIEENEVK